jgi:membrane protein required for beta-lactamase induction
VSTADALFVVNGRESSNHSKTRAFQSWLFCYELTDTLIAITKEKKVVIYCASLKGTFLFLRLAESLWVNTLLLVVLPLLIVSENIGENARGDGEQDHHLGDPQTRQQGR